MLWNDNYLVGNTIVDNDHKEIFGMVDRLLEDDFTDRPDKIRTIVGFLVDYVARHFQNEEKLMEESGYRRMPEHVKQHQNFVKTVEAFVAKVEGDLDNINLSMQVNEVIVDWLAEHVMISDKAMIDHYKKWSA